MLVGRDEICLDGRTGGCLFVIVLLVALFDIICWIRDMNFDVLVDNGASTVRW